MKQRLSIDARPVTITEIHYDVFGNSIGLKFSTYVGREHIGDFSSQSDAEAKAAAWKRKNKP